MSSMTLSIISLVVAGASFTWNVSQFVLGGARPRAELVVGAVAMGGLVYWSPKDDPIGQLARLASQGEDPKPVIGVRVINHGRAPTRIERWSIAGIGAGVSLTPLTDQYGPQLPHDLAPGANAVWVTDIRQVAKAITTSAEVLDAETKSVYVRAELGTGKVLRSAKRLPKQHALAGQAGLLDS